MMRILILNGPNLNLVGRREPATYGTQSLTDYLAQLQQHYASRMSLDTYQSNHEGDLIDKLQAAQGTADAVVINAGGYSHTSVAIADAISAIDIPVVEVHISNIYAREPFRHHSMLAPVCKGSIVGMGLEGYRLAIEGLLTIVNSAKQ